jgi:dephospho-CoA kinase
VGGLAADPRLRIGLTGGIGSGKSLVAAAFRRRGVPVLDADEAGRTVTAPGSAGLDALVARCGAALTPDGHLDRRALRDRMFEQTWLRAEVEAVLHPLIVAELAAAAARSPGPYLVHAIPLLVERGLAGDFHRVLVVDCSEAVQLARILARDGGSEGEARRIIAAQASRAARRAAADDLIENEGTPQALDAAVEALHREYLALSRRPPFPPAGRGGQNSGP